MKYTPPPVRLCDRIRGMETKSSILITKSPYDSVKARVSQIRKEYEPPRRYRTSKQGGGTRVWRDA